MKFFLSVLLFWLPCYFDLHAQCNSTLSNSSESPTDLKISRGTNNNYKIGAWYHTEWYLDHYWGHRSKGYGAKDTLQPLPSQHRIADVWNGVRNVAMNDQFYAGQIPEMDRMSPKYESNYNLAHKPLLGFYDISDQRVMDKQIEMAASRGLYFFGFYNYYDVEGKEKGSDMAVARFKSSRNKDLMKYMINIYQPESCIDLAANFTESLTTTVLDQLAESKGSNTLHSSCLTNDAKQPIIGISAAFVFNDLNIEDSIEYEALNNIAQALRKGIKDRFGMEPIILLSGDSRGMALMGFGAGKYNGKDLYDGYIGFQHLFPEQPAVDYGDITNTAAMCTPFNNNDDLIKSIPASVPVKYNIPSVSVGFDSRPWIPIANQDPTYYANYYFSNTSPAAFAKILNNYKAYIDQNSATTHNMLMCYAWNEWGESGILEPSQAYGYQYLDALNDTFRLKEQVTDVDLNGFSTSYDEWKDLQNWGDTSDENKNYAADPDDDGLENILEYAFDLDPLMPNSYDNEANAPFYKPYDSNRRGGSLTLKYTRDYKKSDLIYFVERSEGAFDDQPNPDLECWDLYWDSNLATNWGSDFKEQWPNLVTTDGTVETRTCAPTQKPRGIPYADYNDDKIKRLRLVVAVLKEGRGKDEPIERFIFPPQRAQNSSAISRVEFSTKAIIYPNPSPDGLFVINLNDEEKALLTVTNSIGQTVTFDSMQDGSIVKMDLSGTAKGIYFVTVTQNNTSTSYKVVISM